jgi:TorA maturation chaperone TorD
MHCTGFAFEISSLLKFLLRFTKGKGMMPLMITQHATEPATEAKAGDLLIPEDAHRSSLYALLSSLLAKAPSQEILSSLSALSGGDNEIGVSIETLTLLTRKVGIRTIEREYQNLFIGVGRGELLPYGSFYMTGFLNEKPLANLRDDMKRIGIARSEGNSDPEDHIASLCEMMSGIISNQFYTQLSMKEQRDFFSTHIGPWARHFFNDLEGAENSVFYAPVGRLGSAFMEVEVEAFRFL